MTKDGIFLDLVMISLFFRSLRITIPRLSPFHRFLQTIEWADTAAISTQTADGLSLKLDISLQYQLQKENIGLLFKNYLRTYEV